MQQMKFTVRPATNFELPNSIGYQLYSALLKIMESSDPHTSKYVHDSDMSSIAISVLFGMFGKSKRPGYKVISSEERYKFHIGITDPGEVEIFKSLIQPLIIEDKDINLEAGSLRIEEVRSKMLSFDELMEKVSEHNGEIVEFNFMSPACIQYKNSIITEMFPHRTAVFTSLLSKWNKVCPPELRMSVERDELGRFIMEKPDAKLYNTHSVMVNTTYDAKRGHHRPIFKQGFTGRCAYSFVRNAPQDVRNAVVALSVFAEYSGVGSSVGRGCGWVKMRMMEKEK